MKNELLHPPGAGRRTPAMVIAVAVAVAVLAAGGVASAHGYLTRSVPPAGTTLTSPPAAVQVWFTEAVDTGSLTVEDAGGGQIAQGGERLEKNSLRVDLPSLDPGNYTVKWRVLSVDGHTVDGSFGFAVTAAAEGGQPAAAEPAVQPEPHDHPAGQAEAIQVSPANAADTAAGGGAAPGRSSLLWGAPILAVLAAAAAFVVVRARRS